MYIMNETESVIRPLDPITLAIETMTVEDYIKLMVMLAKKSAVKQTPVQVPEPELVIGKND